MLSPLTNLCISSLLPGFSIVSMTGAGVIQTTKVLVEGWGQQQVEGWKGKTNLSMSPIRTQIYTYAPRIDKWIMRWMDRKQGIWLDGRTK